MSSLPLLLSDDYQLASYNGNIGVGCQTDLISSTKVNGSVGASGDMVGSKLRQHLDVKRSTSNVCCGSGGGRGGGGVQMPPAQQPRFKARMMVNLYRLLWEMNNST